MDLPTSLPFEQLDAALLASNSLIVHQCFFFLNGQQPPYPALPSMFQPYRDTWLQQNPLWTHIIWTPQTSLALVTNYYPQYLSLYNSFPLPIERSDFMRLCALHRYGGIYADMDTSCRKSMTELRSRFSQPIGLSNDPIHRVANCFMLSQSARHPLWLRLMDCAQRSFSVDPSASVLQTTGPAMMNRLLCEELTPVELAEVMVYDTSVVLWDGSSRLLHPSRIFSDAEAAYVVHHNNYSWKKGKLISVYRRATRFGILLPFIVLLLILFLVTTLFKARQC